MLDLIIRRDRQIHGELLKLSWAIAQSKVYRPKTLQKFIFLCGANKTDGEVSERRRAILDFADKNLPHTRFFLAERMLDTLKKEGHSANLIDIESEICNFADNIIIVLESPSAFAELGAFAHHMELRKKIIVINDLRFKDTESFINLGPIAAIKEKAGEASIIHYRMSTDGIELRDSIGEVFSALAFFFKAPRKKYATPINLEECNPAMHFSKESAMFVHDLIFFTGPIKHKELIVVLNIIYKSGNFKLSEHVAILTAFNSISRDERGYFRTLLQCTYFEYRFDFSWLMFTFRSRFLRFDSARFYDC